jgi:hypothetical protein
MTDTTLPPVLSAATNASVQGLVRAKHDITQWTKNLERALADDVAAGRLTPDEAAEVAKTNEVKAPPAPGSKEEAKETTAEANQAQLDAQTKVAEAEAAKDQKAAAAAQPKQDEPAKPKDDDDKAPKAKDEKPPASHTTHTGR